MVGHPGTGPDRGESTKGGLGAGPEDLTRRTSLSQGGVETGEKMACGGREGRKTGTLRNEAEG